MSFGCGSNGSGDAAYEVLGKALATLITSDEGSEVVYRVSLAGFSGLPWCRNVVADAVRELDLLSSDCLKTFSVQARSLISHDQYGVVDGVMSPLLESLSFLRYLTYCDPTPSPALVCCRLKQIREVVGELDRLFFCIDGIGVNSERHLKPGRDVEWDKVGLLLARDDLEFGFTFRNPKIMEVLSSMEAVSQHNVSVGRVFDHLGPNLLAMMCRCIDMDSDQHMLPVVKAFHQRDVQYVKLVQNTRCHCLGEAPENILLLCHERLDGVGSLAFGVMHRLDRSNLGNSDALTAKSLVFRFLRDEFRAGPQYRSEVDDDYGQPL
jgi:hypothetical protein